MKIEFEKVCFEFVLFLGEGNIIDSRYIGNFFKLSANYDYLKNIFGNYRKNFGSEKCASNFNR